jgi:hypothetical protein
VEEMCWLIWIRGVGGRRGFSDLLFEMNFDDGILKLIFRG